jgi:hypothetical protein
MVMSMKYCRKVIPVRNEVLSANKHREKTANRGKRQVEEIFKICQSVIVVTFGVFMKDIINF